VDSTIDTDKYLNYALIMFCMTELFMYHAFRCVNELLLNAMACLIVAVTHIFYSELNVLLCLNACGYIIPA
jgi:hypothetical protein